VVIQHNAQQLPAWRRVGNRIPSAGLTDAGFLFDAEDKNKKFNKELPARTKATVMN
jgi:hypothetical protein